MSARVATTTAATSTTARTICVHLVDDGLVRLYRRPCGVRQADPHKAVSIDVARIAPEIPRAVHVAGVQRIRRVVLHCDGPQGLRRPRIEPQGDLHRPVHSVRVGGVEVHKVPAIEFLKGGGLSGGLWGLLPRDHHVGLGGGGQHRQGQEQDTGQKSRFHFIIPPITSPNPKEQALAHRENRRGARMCRAHRR